MADEPHAHMEVPQTPDVEDAGTVKESKKPSGKYE